MVKFGSNELEECMAIGREAAAYISEQFPQPIKLEFEKVILSVIKTVIL